MKIWMCNARQVRTADHVWRKLQRIGDDDARTAVEHLPNADERKERRDQGRCVPCPSCGGAG